MSIATCVLSPNPVAASARRHDLDALRAFAMLLGIVLHGALSFIDFPWAVQDRFREPSLGLLVAAIHGFRMPLFFLLSGFFTAMLWRRRGVSGMLRQRAKRIALPMALAWVTIVPMVWGVWTWAASGNNANPANDIFTAAAQGDLSAVRNHVRDGAPLDGEDSTYGQNSLAWAVIGNHPEVVSYLLEAGADPSARCRDRNTALHTAAFFGRDEEATLLLDAGADISATNTHGETPLDSLRHDRATTEYIAGLLQIPVDFDAVQEGRDRIRTMLEDRGSVARKGSQTADDQGGLAGLLKPLMFSDFFLHLWFLWFLCWLVAGFAVVGVIAQSSPPIQIPAALVQAPVCLLWLIPLTMLTQSFMHGGGTMPGFGPDDSAGLLPVPHVLAHYGIFFGFGALLFTCSGTNRRLGRHWQIQLAAALLVLPVALGFALHMPWARELAGDEATRRWVASLGEVLYAWLMVFGLTGLFEAILNRERPRVRFVADSSYWVYLIHLPLVIAGQALLRDVNLPATAKLGALVAVSTVILLASYRYLVRHRWIGRLLNGPARG